jgi:hypothetical protein
MPVSGGSAEPCQRNRRAPRTVCSTDQHQRRTNTRQDDRFAIQHPQFRPQPAHGLCGAQGAVGEHHKRCERDRCEQSGESENHHGLYFPEALPTALLTACGNRVENADRGISVPAMEAMFSFCSHLSTCFCGGLAFFGDELRLDFSPMRR